MLSNWQTSSQIASWKGISVKIAWTAGLEGVCVGAHAHVYMRMYVFL